MASFCFAAKWTCPQNWAGQDLTLGLGAIDDNDVTYWNGAQIGATQGWGEKRSYKIPGAQVKAGRNVIAVRVTDNSGGGGFDGEASEMKLQRAGANPIALSGAWKYRDRRAAGQNGRAAARNQSQRSQSSGRAL